MPTATLQSVLEAVAHQVIAAAEELTALDSAIGDGDHGLNMKRGFEAVLADSAKLASLPPGEALKSAGLTLVMKVGGASGPLYGTLLMAMGKELAGPLDRAHLAGAFAAAILAVKARGKSDVGQKTMLDVLVPVSAALSRGDDLVDIRRVAVEAATVPMLAIRGRASFLGERSIGHMDPGARSSQLMIATILDQLEGKT